MYIKPLSWILGVSVLLIWLQCLFWEFDWVLIIVNLLDKLAVMLKNQTPHTISSNLIENISSNLLDLLLLVALIK